MKTLGECVTCSQNSTCGFRCYYYWNPGKRARPIPQSSPTSVKKQSEAVLDSRYPSHKKAKLNESESCKSKEQAAFIDRCEGDEEADQLELECSSSLQASSVFEEVSESSHSTQDWAASTSDTTVEGHKDHIDTLSFQDAYFIDQEASQDQPSKLKDPFIYQGQSSQQSTLASDIEESFLAPTTEPKLSPTTSPSESLQKKYLPDTLSCIDRKRIIVFECPATVKKAMQVWYTDTLTLLDPFRSSDECWFHPSPRLPSLSRNPTATNSPLPAANSSSTSILPPLLRQKTTISRKFSWADLSTKSRHTLALNFGVVAKLLQHTLTKQQKDGFITRGWHLSHLCGNWTCLNDRHTTVEPGQVNVGRNNCFSHRQGCVHVPGCLKDRKMPFEELVKRGEVEEWGGGEEEWMGVWFGDDDDNDGDDLVVEEMRAGEMQGGLEVDEEENSLVMVEMKISVPEEIEDLSHDDGVGRRNGDEMKSN